MEFSHEQGFQDLVIGVTCGLLSHGSGSLLERVGGIPEMGILPTVFHPLMAQ